MRVAHRIAMLPRLGLLLFALLVFAPAKTAPSKSDKALRERASQFLQYTIDRTYRKAYELVSKDTKDWYLSSGKPQYTAFKIDSIEYSKDFRQATVKTKVTSTLSMNGHDTSTEVLRSDIWKLQDGKWMWWHDPDVLVTPFGEIKIDRSKMPVGASPVAVPRDTSPSAVEAAGGNINLGASGPSKNELVFEEGIAGGDEFVYHNGLPGLIVVNADIVGDYRAFSVEPHHMEIEAGKEVTVKISYKPSANPAPSVVRLTLEPLEREVKIPLKFKPAAP